MAKRSSQGLLFENEVRGALKRIGFENVAGGPDFKVGGYQVDACGGWDDVLLVAECTQSTTEEASIRNLIFEFRGKQAQLRKEFRKLDRYSYYKRFVFAIITQNITYRDNDNQIADQQPKVHLIDFNSLQYYQRLTPLIGRGALFNLLGELQVSPRDLTLPRLPAFRVELRKNLLAYLFWCDPSELLKIAYVARRESGRKNYYQRILAPGRLTKIAKFVDDGNVFPNSIILAFDKKPMFRPKMVYEDNWPQYLEFGELVFPNSYRSAWIIDGQHRLYAFSKARPESKRQKLPVFAFESISETLQAKFFIEINDKQVPVSKDLIWDLAGDMQHPNTPEWQISNCVKALNCTPALKDKVFLPLSGKRETGQLKMSGVCQDLRDVGLLKDRTSYMNDHQRNPLTRSIKPEQMPDRVARAVGEFLEELKTYVRQAVWDNVLLRPGGITLVFGVYEHVLIELGQFPSREQIRPYAKAFAGVLSNMLPSESVIRQFVRERLTSYAQRRQLLGETLDQMQQQLGDPQFGIQYRREKTPTLDDRLIRFERRLAEFVVEVLGISTIEGLRQRSPEGVWRKVSEITESKKATQPDFTLHMAFTLGQLQQVIERKDNASKIMPRFTDPLEGFGDDQAMMAALSGITRARNDAFHGRRVGNVHLTTAYLETFERLLSL